MTTEQPDFGIPQAPDEPVHPDVQTQEQPDFGIPQAPDEPVHPDVQTQLDREARERQAVTDAEDEAQRVLAEREAKESEQLSQEVRDKVARNERVDVGDEAVFLSGTGHNESDDDA